MRYSWTLSGFLLALSMLAGGLLWLSSLSADVRINTLNNDLLNSKLDVYKELMIQQHGEITTRLDRIEEKVDSHLEEDTGND